MYNNNNNCYTFSMVNYTRVQTVMPSVFFDLQANQELLGRLIKHAFLNDKTYMLALNGN